jgi:hypothetical protein
MVCSLFDVRVDKEYVHGLMLADSLSILNSQLLSAFPPFVAVLLRRTGSIQLCTLDVRF